jgi:acyl-coenzyme A thioesterase PaaI-like protein
MTGDAVDDLDAMGLSIQDRLYPGATCFGCGLANPKGLHLRSFAQDDVVVATFMPWPEHGNGLGHLNGGIIATLLDCHSGAAVFHEADRQGWTAAPGLAFPYVTAGLDVRYLRPAPLLEPVELRAVIAAADESVITVDVQLVWDGKPRAEASTMWKRWRPRS